MGFPRQRKWSQVNVNVSGDPRCLNPVKDTVLGSEWL